jgi:hypothetical protein
MAMDRVDGMKERGLALGDPGGMLGVLTSFDEGGPHLDAAYDGGRVRGDGVRDDHGGTVGEDADHVGTAAEIELPGGAAGRMNFEPVPGTIEQVFDHRDRILVRLHLIRYGAGSLDG